MQDRVLKGIAGVLGIILVVFVAAKARNSFEEYHYIGKVGRDRDTISIEGTGKITARPDVARVNIGIQTDATTVKEAQRKNTERMNAIIAALKSMDIKAEDIQTANFSVYPQQEWKDGRSRVIGYQVSQSVTVKIRDLDKAGDVLAKAGDLGANTVNGPDFIIDNPMKLREDARAKAIEDAKTKAGQLADELGVDMGRVVGFSEYASGSGPQPPIMYKAMAMDAAAVALPSPTIEPGSSDVEVRANVIFELR